MNIGVVTAVCEEDARWVDQYLAELVRVGVKCFAVHFDRCSDELKRKMISHSLYLGSTHQDDMGREFNEQDKQGPMDILRERGNVDWSLLWDIDEVWEKTAPQKLEKIVTMTDCDYLTVRWVNLWGDEKHIRVDSPFNFPPRVKLYNMRGRHWYFDHKITNGCKMLDMSLVEAKVPLYRCVANGYGKQGDTDLVCVHHGNMTRELREFHKVRWDRIYTRAVGSNPLKFWNYMLDEATYPPTIEEHDLL